LPQINYGSFALDDGNYTLTKDEKDSLLNNEHGLEELFKPFVGAKELLQGYTRYCLWITDKNLSIAVTSPEILKRINNVKKWRSNSDRTNTRELAEVPHLFAEVRQPSTTYLAFPTISSERREYVPSSFLEPSIIASNQLYIIPIEKSIFYVFGIISSKMHMVWIRAVGGRLKTDLRYSSALCYNTFPFPEITPKQKESLASHVYNILEEREKYPEKTMADLYDPDKMPDGLREAHKYLDLAIDQIYRNKPFESDEDRLAHLFKLYEDMITGETNKK
jgi:hypothetical protein